MSGQRWGRRGRDVVSLILISIAWFKFEADFNYGLRGDGQQLRRSNSSPKGEILLLLLLLPRCPLNSHRGLLQLAISERSEKLPAG